MTLATSGSPVANRAAARPLVREPPDVGGQAKARAMLALIGADMRPANDVDLTLRELVSWRRGTIDAMRQAVERDMVTSVPRRSGLFGTGRLLAKHEAGMSDWVALGTSVTTAAAFLGAAVWQAVANKGVSALATIPVGLYLGFCATAFIGAVGHITTDQFISRPHVPGEPEVLATNVWSHHTYPKNVVGIHPVRMFGGAALGSTALTTGILAATAGIQWAVGAPLGVGPLAASVLAVMTVGGGLWVWNHSQTHHGDNVSQVTKACRGWLLDDPVHHGVHHWGDRQGLLPAEPALRHAEAFAGFGTVDPCRWLDDMGFFTAMVRGVGRLIGRKPESHIAHPAWVQYWEASSADKPMAMLNARIETFQIERSAFAYDLEVAQRTAASTSGDEKSEAETYATKLVDRIAVIDDGIAELERRKAALGAG